MLVVTLTAQELKGYSGELGARIHDDAEAEARDRGQRTVRIVAPDGKLVEQFVVETVPRSRVPRTNAGLSPGVLDQVAKRIPDTAAAWRKIEATWKEKRKVLGQRWIGGLYLYEGVYYRIVRGKPVRSL